MAVGDQQRVAVITAAADGIGQATALAFHAAGYRVALVDRNEAGARITASAMGDDALVIAADVTDEAAVAAVAARVVDRFGGVDSLINVVGGSRPGLTTAELSLEDWNRLLAFNLTSTFLMCRAFLPLLEARREATIVNVSSGAGIDGMSKNPAYVAAKAGVVAFTRALAIDHERGGGAGQLRRPRSDPYAADAAQPDRRGDRGDGSRRTRRADR